MRNDLKSRDILMWIDQFSYDGKHLPEIMKLPEDATVFRNDEVLIEVGEV